MSDAEQRALRAAIELLYGCSAHFQTHEIVTLQVGGRRSLQRDVATFSLRGLAGATACYAWTETGVTGRVAHHRVVLHAGPVLSPRDAVRASLLREPPEQAPRTPDDLPAPGDRRRGAVEPPPWASDEYRPRPS
ncbi:MAG TPA: hypothetical protein VLE53_11565 [Gemmatimonadaceae bacterium]|nr:hypothetical protein [Gemmatimonadaceae bacterium]